MRRMILVGVLGVVAAFGLPGFTLSYGGASISGAGIGIASADDSNGDIQSNCHEGEMGLGAGGNDKIGGDGDCIPGVF